MKRIINLNLFFLCIFVLGACSPSDDLELTENHENHETYEIDDTPFVENITENVLENILDEFKIMDIIKSDENINPALNYSSQSLAKRVSKDKNCSHEITNTIDNKLYNFDLSRDYTSNPLTEAEIQQIVNAPIVSTTESSIKYFLSDKTPSTDCETEEINAPIPNHDNRDALLRPTFYSYSSIFDYTGEHHFLNEFYIERSEITTPTGWSEASSKFITKGILEKRVDRVHQVHIKTDVEHSHVEDLKLSGFMRSQEGYRFHFMNGSNKYFKYSFAIQDEFGSPTYGLTEIDMVNRYVVQFYINYVDGHGRVNGVFRVPFMFDITIDYEEIIETLKENGNTTPYTKTVPLYVKSGDTNRNIGNVKFTLDEEEKWSVDVTESPLIISDSELDYIIDNFN